MTNHRPPDNPSTISDADWRRLQEAAAEAAGGLVKNDSQKAKANAWGKQRKQSGKN